MVPKCGSQPLATPPIGTSPSWLGSVSTRCSTATIPLLNGLHSADREPSGLRAAGCSYRLNGKFAKWHSPASDARPQVAVQHCPSSEAWRWPRPSDTCHPPKTGFPAENCRACPLAGRPGRPGVPSSGNLPPFRAPANEAYTGAAWRVCRGIPHSAWPIRDPGPQPPAPGAAFRAVAACRTTLVGDEGRAILVVVRIVDRWRPHEVPSDPLSAPPARALQPPPGRPGPPAASRLRDTGTTLPFRTDERTLADADGPFRALRYTAPSSCRGVRGTSAHGRAFRAAGLNAVG
jgi:hypothetical protein